MFRYYRSGRQFTTLLRSIIQHPTCLNAICFSPLCDSQALNILPDEHPDRITQQHHINLRDFNRREHTYSETYGFWTLYIEKGILDTITWPTDHLQLAAERYSLDIPDMPRTLQIHLIEQCMRGEGDLGWYELIKKVITIQRIFRGYRERKPWIDVAYP